jgi:hypothetical protein
MTCRSCGLPLHPADALEVIATATGAISYLHKPSVMTECWERTIRPRAVESIRAMVPLPAGWWRNAQDRTLDAALRASERGRRRAFAA